MKARPNFVKAIKCQLSSQWSMLGANKIKSNVPQSGGSISREIISKSRNIFALAKRPDSFYSRFLPASTDLAFVFKAQSCALSIHIVKGCTLLYFFLAVYFIYVDVCVCLPRRLLTLFVPPLFFRA